MKSSITKRTIWTIAYPIMFGNLAQTLITLTDTAFLGRVSAIALGASMMAGIYYYVYSTLAWGFAIGVQIIGSGWFSNTGLFLYWYWHRDSFCCNIFIRPIFCTGSSNRPIFMQQPWNIWITATTVLSSYVSTSCSEHCTSGFPIQKSLAFPQP